MLNENAVYTLYTLCRLCKEGHEGYIGAAHAIESELIARLFTAYADQRRKFADELVDILMMHSDLDIISGTRSKNEDMDTKPLRRFIPLARAWDFIALQNGDYDALLNVCCEGEATTGAAYRTALRHMDFPEDVRTILERHQSQIASACQRLTDFIQLSHLRQARVV